VASDWRDRALCFGMDVSAFFPLKADVITPEAKKACGACRVRPDCLEWALHKPEKYGSWAGLSEKELAAERRRRGRRAARERGDEDAQVVA
jgi:WhiB family redox-sensing transcriptional regulator